MANNDKENKIEKFTKEAIGKTLNQFNKEIGVADLVEVNKNQDRILNGILSQVNDENTEKTEKSNIITLDNSTDGVVELKEIQGDTNVNVSKIEEMPITHDIGDKEGNVFTLNEITKGAISIGEIQGNTMVNCNKDDEKELVLMKDLSTQGDNNITLTEGVDGGLVDVALEGNTLVNVSKTKDSTAITKSYTVENIGNHIALQGDIDGSCRPVVTGNTLVNLFKGFYSENFTIDGDNYTATRDETTSGYANLPMNLIYELTNGKTYTAIIDIKTNTLDGAFYIGGTDRVGFTSNVPINTTGVYKYVFTYDSSAIDKPSTFYIGFNGSKVKGTLSINKNIIILEGDYTDKPIPDYFDGLQSSFEDRVVPERLAHFPSTILTTPSSGYTHREFGDTLSLKPSTTYTIVQKAHKTTNHSPVNTNAHPYTLVFGGRQGVSDSWIVRANPPVGDIKEGVSAYTLTTPNDFVISTQTFMVIVEENRGSEFELEVSIFEGDYTNYNFSDYDPTKVGKYRVEYKVTGKNKAYGLKQQIPDVLTTKINVTKGKSYTYSTQNIADGTCRISICDSEPYNNESLSNAEIQLISDWGGGNHTWVSEVTGTVWFIIWQRDITINSNSTLQIEEGATATSYEPYKESTKTLYLNSPLLEGDTIEEKDGSIYHVHRYEEVVLDGNEKWSTMSNWSNYFPDTLGYTRFQLRQSNLYFNLEDRPITIISDKFPSISNANWKTLSEHIENDIKDINIVTTKASTVDEFKLWLQQNPVTAVYKLAEPQYELIEQSNLAIPSYTNGNLDLTSAVPVSKVNFLHFEEELTYLYPATSYTVQFMSDKAISVDIALGGTSLLAQNIVKGLNRISITTPETLVDNKLVINGVGANVSEVVVTNTDREFAYFEGMKSVGEGEELEITSANSDNTLSNTRQLTHEPLRAVGEVKDRYVLIDGKWYIERNFDEKVLNGTENYTLDASTQLGDYFVISANSLPNIDAGSLYVKCDKLPAYYGSIYTTPTRGIYYVQKLKFKLLKSELPSVNIDNFKTWLSNNPIRIVYQLATPTYEPIDYNPLEVYSGTTHITTNSVIPANITIKNHGFNCLLKPSTTYTISSNLGLNTVTTGADIGDSCLRFYDEDTSDVTTMRDVLILEGDWTTKADLIPANFSGIESAFEQELVTDENDANYGKYRVNAKVVGKNLLGTKVEAFLGRPYGNDIYAFQQHPNADAVSYIIPCLPNTTYSLSSLGDRNVMAEFNHYPINGDIVTNVYGRTITTSNTAKWLVVYINSLWTNDDLHAQLEYGDTVTAYEPYKENNVTFYLNEPLRGIGDVKDKVFIQDDKVVVQRNCGSATFNGSDDELIILNADRGNLIEFMVSEPSIPNRAGVKYVATTLPNVEGLVEKIVCGYQVVYIQLQKARLQSVDVAGFKQWLQQSPTTVVYQLAEPVYEEVKYSSNRLILDTFNNESFNNSTLFLDTTILPKLSFKPLYEELVYVKNSTKYYIQFNAVGSGEVVINLGGTELTTEIVEGYNCIPITTPSESTNLMTISGQGITISEVVVSEVVCGGYYKGLQSCFEEHMENGKYRILLRGIALDGSKVNGIKLYINEPLRGVEGVKDRLCIKNGKLIVERNYDSVTLDGTGNIYDVTSWGASSDKTIEFRLGYNQFENKKVDILCDNFISETSNLWMMDTEGIQSYTVDTVDIRINKTRLSTQDVAGFRQWLQQNPTTIVYQLTSPIYEEVTNEYGLPIVFEGYENGIVYIDSAVTPTTHIKYTSNNQLATTLSEAEEQNIATQEDINMNVVTYMMDIDMILTEMEMSNDTSVMAVRRDSSNENMLDRMSEEDKKVYRDNTVVMLEKMITANVLDKEDIERRVQMYYDKGRISKEQYEYLKSLL